MLPENFVPVFVTGIPTLVGAVTPAVAEILSGEQLALKCENSLLLPASGTDLQACLEAITTTLWQRGLIGEFRGEDMSVMAGFDDPVLATIDRSALRIMGFPGVKVHINGLVETAEGPQIWLARRAANRRSAPLHLDTMVAGGQPHGKTLYETAVMEGWEEAGLAATQLANVRQPYVWHAQYVSPEGFHHERLVVYDLNLAPDFQPECVDDEIIDTFRVSKTELIRLIEGGDRFKHNTELVCRHLLGRI